MKNIKKLFLVLNIMASPIQAMRKEVKAYLRSTSNYTQSSRYALSIDTVTDKIPWDIVSANLIPFPYARLKKSFSKLSVVDALSFTIQNAEELKLRDNKFHLHIREDQIIIYQDHLGSLFVASEMDDSSLHRIMDAELIGTPPDPIVANFKSLLSKNDYSKKKSLRPNQYKKLQNFCRAKLLEKNKKPETMHTASSLPQKKTAQPIATKKKRTRKNKKRTRKKQEDFDTTLAQFKESTKLNKEKQEAPIRKIPLYHAKNAKEAFQIISDMNKTKQKRGRRHTNSHLREKLKIQRELLQEKNAGNLTDLKETLYNICCDNDNPVLYKKTKDGKILWLYIQDDGVLPEEYEGLHILPTEQKFEQISSAAYKQYQSHTCSHSDFCNCK